MKRRVRERVVGVSAEDEEEAVDEVGRELIVVCHWPTLLLLNVGHELCHTTCHMSHRKYCSSSCSIHHITLPPLLRSSVREQRRIGDHSFGLQTVAALIVDVGSNFMPCNIATFRSATSSKSNNRRRSWLSCLLRFDTRGVSLTSTTKTGVVCT